MAPQLPPRHMCFTRISTAQQYFHFLINQYITTQAERIQLSCVDMTPIYNMFHWCINIYIDTDIYVYTYIHINIFHIYIDCLECYYLYS